MEPLDQVADIIVKSGEVIALTGAGISVDSGIPDFRSPGGLWDRFNPAEYATIEAFRADPGKVWRLFVEVAELLERCEPNTGHTALAELEALGLLDAIITQNIDNLHQRAGSSYVVEYHGNGNQLHCIECGFSSSQEFLEKVEMPPHCPSCGAVLKPQVVLFCELIPPDAMLAANLLASKCKILLVIGTSAEVSPANLIPAMARSHGATIVEMNLESTHLTHTVTDHLIQGSCTNTLPALVKAVRERLH